MSRLPRPRGVSRSEESEEAPLANPQNPPPGTTEPTTAKEAIPRLTIPLTSDGAPLWDRMRTETADKVRSFLRAHGQPATAPDAAPGDMFEPMVVRALYEAIGSLAVVVAVSSGHTRESSEVMRLTPPEIESVTPLTQRLLAKYGASIARWQDECALAIVLTTVFSAKTKQLVRVTRPTAVPIRSQQPQPENPGA